MSEAKNKSSVESKSSGRGSVGDEIHLERSTWSFAGGVAQSFERHAEKSIPLYREGHKLIAGLSEFYCRENSLSYEFGCSTGLLTREIAKRHADKSNCRFLGLDIEANMIEKAKVEFSKNPVGDCQFLEADILTHSLEPSVFCVLYYTLHFLPVADRKKLLSRICESLLPGGALVVFEKVLAENARIQDFQTRLYEDFKLEKGYKLEEIKQKSRSLNSVLQPLTRDENLELFNGAGFSSVTTISKYLGFEGFLIIA